MALHYPQCNLIECSLQQRLNGWLTSGSFSSVVFWVTSLEGISQTSHWMMLNDLSYCYYCVISSWIKLFEYVTSCPAGHRLPVPGLCCCRGLLGRPRHAPPPRHQGHVVPVATRLQAPRSATRFVWRGVARGPRPAAVPVGYAPQPGAAAGQGALEQPDDQGEFDHLSF